MNGHCRCYSTIHFSALIAMASPEGVPVDLGGSPGPPEPLQVSTDTTMISGERSDGLNAAGECKTCLNDVDHDGHGLVDFQAFLCT